MALAQRIEQVDRPSRSLSAYADDPLPALIRREIDELHIREAALPARSSTKARRLIVSAVVGGAASWALVIGAANYVAHLIA